MPPHSPAWRTEAHWRRWGEEAADLFLEDRAVRMIVRLPDRPEVGIIGQLNLNMLTRGPYQPPTLLLGAQVIAQQQGRGLMMKRWACTG